MFINKIQLLKNDKFDNYVFYFETYIVNFVIIPWDYWLYTNDKKIIQNDMNNFFVKFNINNITKIIYCIIGIYLF